MKPNRISRVIGGAVAASAMFVGLGTGAHAAYEVIDVSGGGSVTGKVSFSGELPADAVEQIAITKNPDVCGTGNREVVWVDVKDGALRNTFVFLDKVDAGKDWDDPGEGYLINQEKCRFNPWAQVVRPGEITIRNSDHGVLHNINTRELIGVEKGRVVKKTMFNFGQPDPGDIVEQIKTSRSPYIAINCEAHNFMFGFMMAPKHPYAVVVGEDGSFSIDNIPPGEYTLKAWHPRFGIQKATIVVPDSGSATADFTFSLDS